MDERNDFLATFMNYALVIRGDIKDIMKLKEELADIAETCNLKIVYQQLDPRKLKVVAENENY